MGEVYRAKDTRLDRTVAIKILSSHLSKSSDLRQRFEREARAISSLSHAHICGLYDVGSQDGTEFLVMEFLEGETLAHRLNKGPLSTEQMLRYAIQIADALDKAHRQGIIHRDLKPGNIMVTKSGVKLLDFGLAKLRPAGLSPELSSVSVLPTEAREITNEGTILGTIQYMSPEQLEGKEADARADIFSFGSVLYEMATGKRAFTGSSQASLMSAILKDEPQPISRVQPLAPPALDRVVKTCLAKDPDERWQNAHDLMKELIWIGESNQANGKWAVKPLRRVIFPWLFAVFFALTTVSIWFAHAYRDISPQRQMRLSISPPPDNELVEAPVISPDGLRILFPAADKNGKVYLWLRSMDASAAQKLPGTEAATYPFWSADSRFIGFFANSKLMKLDLSSGLSHALCDVSDERGGTWNQNGVIVFSPNPGDGLYRISSSGGSPSRLTSLDASAQESSHRLPYFLPDGKHFLFYVKAQKEEGIYIGSLDSHEKSFVLKSERSGIFCSGYLLFQRANTLFAQPFDTKKLKLDGEAVPVFENVWYEPVTWGSRGVTASQDNLLAYTEGTNLSQLLWFDRTGKQVGSISSPDQYAQVPAFSPDGNRFAMRVVDGGFSHLWLYSTSTGERSRMTFSPSNDSNPRWSPEGTRIIYNSNRTGSYKLYLRDAGGGGNDQLLYQSKNWCISEDWSPNGEYIIFSEVDPNTKYDLWILPLNEPNKAFPFVKTDANESNAKFSPDGKWIAYSSDESGRPEVYVQSFRRELAGKWQASTNGGFTPKWSRDGKELFYLSSNNQVMSSEVKLSTTFEINVPRALFSIHPYAIPRIGLGTGSEAFEPAPDGRRFAVHAPLRSSPPNITIVLNWQLMLNRKAR